MKKTDVKINIWNWTSKNRIRIMTTEELISKLQEFPKDTEVVKFYEFGFGGSNEYEPELDYYPNQNKVYL